MFSSHWAERLGPSEGPQREEVTPPSCKAESGSGVAVGPECRWGPTEEKQRQREGARRPCPGAHVEDSRVPASLCDFLEEHNNAECVWPSPQEPGGLAGDKTVGLVECHGGGVHTVS